MGKRSEVDFNNAFFCFRFHATVNKKSCQNLLRRITIGFATGHNLTMDTINDTLAEDVNWEPLSTEFKWVSLIDSKYDKMMHNDVRPGFRTGSRIKWTGRQPFIWGLVKALLCRRTGQTDTFTIWLDLFALSLNRQIGFWRLGWQVGDTGC